MKIAVYTLTRDRLDYTKHCFSLLREKAGVEFDHYVIDNGSQDGTQEWLKKDYKPFACVLSERNLGISTGSNLALKIISRKQYDMICKFDNDCEVVSDNILGQMVEVFEDQAVAKFGPRYVLSPRVEGIKNQPYRASYRMLSGRRIGITAVVGGLFHCVPTEVYELYTYPKDLPLAKGQDEHFCHWVKKFGGEVGYVEGLTVNHYKTTDGQYLDNPAYFERKWEEEKKCD